MKHEKPLIICLTPIKNEAWILDRFLKCASLWADKIIISDQGSEDNSVEIARSYPKVTLIENPVDDYDEYKIRIGLFDEARKIKGHKLLIAMDADETFTPDYAKTDDWQRLLSAKPGTIIKSRFVNIRPDMKNYWFGPFNLPWGFTDDGSPYTAGKIHTSRMIEPSGAEILLIKDFYIIHYQYADWDRMSSKHRWYQCWERLNRPENSRIILYRSYHHMYSIKKNDIHLVPGEWFEGYYKSGINSIEIKKDKIYYWDKIVLDYLFRYGTQIFKLIDIWDINWVKLAEKYGFSNPESFKDPRNIFNKIVLFWLRKTQYNHNNFFVKAGDKILKIIFKI